MNDRMETVVCNFCGSEDQKTKYIKDGFKIVKCEVCGLVFVNPRLNRSSVEQLYDESYFKGGGFDKSIEYKKEFEEQSNKVDLVDWDLSTILELKEHSSDPVKSRILDIGSGMGLLLWKAKMKGFETEGLELSRYACGFVESMGIKVQNKSIYEAELKPDHYNAIVMKEVIEHLPDPKVALKKVYDALAPGGVLFLTTGNFDSPERKLRGKNWFYFMPEGHLYIFSNRTMRKYLEETGFREIRVTNQGDLVMNLLLKYGILDTDRFKPEGPFRRVVFEAVRFINHFISSGLRVYALK